MEKNNTKLKKYLDIMSLISLVFAFIVFPIIGHYEEGIRDESGNLKTVVILMLLNILPAVFGLPWLFFRYHKQFSNNFPNLSKIIFPDVQAMLKR